jgi:subtilisin family serine protease
MMDNEPDENVYEIDLILHETPNKTPEELASRVVEVSGVAAEELEVLPRKIRLTVHQDRIEELAKLDSVNRIEEVRPNSLWNDQASAIRQAREMPGLEELTYKGSGQVVCVADSGFDRGIAADTDNAKVHPAFTNRVVRLLSIWTGRDASDPIGHGTHVCGSICGAGAYKDSKGSTVLVQGAAPAANIMVQAMTKPKGEGWDIKTPADTSQLFSDAYQSGARVHSNSWGTKWPGSQLGYEQDATAIDIFVCQNPDFTVLVAAGNNAEESNHGESQIGANASAKNCITVGAVGTARPNDGSGYNLASKTPTGVTDVADFSSRGPTLATKDKNGQTVLGRIKPDVVAPGVAILSAASRAMEPHADLRTRFGKTDDADYMYMAGTSMATPLVAGCVALLREVLAEQGTLHPSAALLKALLVNAAIKDVDAKSPNPIFDYQKGFGRVDVKKSIAMIKQASFIDGGNLLDETSPPRLGVTTEEERTWQSPPLAVPPGGSLIATLTYPDPPGALLQNDVHLIVRSGDGKERHGNMPEHDSGFDMISKSHSHDAMENPMTKVRVV